MEEKCRGKEAKVIEMYEELAEIEEKIKLKATVLTAEPDPWTDQHYNALETEDKEKWQKAQMAILENQRIVDQIKQKNIHKNPAGETRPEPPKVEEERTTNKGDTAEEETETKEAKAKAIAELAKASGEARRKQAEENRKQKKSKEQEAKQVKNEGNSTDEPMVQD